MRQFYKSESCNIGFDRKKFWWLHNNTAYELTNRELVLLREIDALEFKRKSNADDYGD